jgi:DNA-directed RNA polymerase sigma subunit (sigma70/sigma32)
MAKTSDYKKFMEKSAKNRERIVALRGEGKTLERIGALMGITRQRVKQILDKAGVE